MSREALIKYMLHVVGRKHGRKETDLTMISRAIKSVMVPQEEREVNESKVLKGGKYGLVLPELMLNNFAHGFGLYIVVGNLGAGKSSYAFKVAREFLDKYGRRFMTSYRWRKWKELDEDDKYRYIMNNYMVFTFDELKFKAKHSSWKNRMPLLIWDDAGVYGSSYLFFVDKYLAMALAGIIQTIRSRIANLIMTVPAPDLVARVVRIIPERVIVAIDSLSGWNSKARGYRMFFTPKKYYNELIYIDYFNRKLPNTFYSEYMERRDSYVDESISMYEDAIEFYRLKREYMRRQMKARMKKMREENQKELSNKVSEAGDADFKIDFEFIPPQRD